MTVWEGQFFMTKKKVLIKFERALMLKVTLLSREHDLTGTKLLSGTISRALMYRIHNEYVNCEFCRVSFDIVVGGCCYAFMSNGSFKSSAVVFDDTVKLYNTSNVFGGWVLSLQLAVSCFVGNMPFQLCFT